MSLQGELSSRSLKQLSCYLASSNPREVPLSLARCRSTHERFTANKRNKSIARAWSGQRCFFRTSSDPRRVSDKPHKPKRLVVTLSSIVTQRSNQLAWLTQNETSFKPRAKQLQGLRSLRGSKQKSCRVKARAEKVSPQMTLKFNRSAQTRSQMSTCTKMQASSN